MEEHDKSENYGQTHQEYLGSCSVETDAGVVAGEEVSALAKSLALSGSVAIRNSAEMDVSVCVRSHQLEDEVAATAAFLPAFRCPTAFSLRVALN